MSDDFLLYDILHPRRFIKREKIMDSQNYNFEGKFYTTVDGVPVRKLFVGNLPPDTNPIELHRQLSQKLQPLGQVREINVIQRPSLKPFAFVMFYTPQDAAKVLQMKNNLFLSRKKLFVSPADSWHQPHEMPDGSIIWDRRKMKTEEPKAESGSEAEDGDNEGEDEEEAEEAGQKVVNPNNEAAERKGPNVESGSGDAEAKEKEGCLINKLNDDCLCLIFDKLSIRERMSLGSVCRRWRGLNSHFWRSFKKLDFTVPPLQYVDLTDNKLKYFLHHCVNANRLNIGQDVNHLTSESIISIAKSCKDLEELHLRCIGLQSRSLAFLANCCPSLKSFSVEDCHHLIDGEMMSFVRKARNLESISLKYSRKTHGHWLEHLKGPINSLTLEMYACETNSLVKGISRISSTLRHLTLVSCAHLKSNDLETIVSLCPDLTKIGLSGMRPLRDCMSIEPIAKLSKLEQLDLEQNRCINDRFIESLVDGCQNLKQLNISGMEPLEVTEKGLTQLAKLADLQSLSMAGIGSVTDSVLKSLSKKLTKLEHLDITSCLKVTNEGCIEILNNCSQLKTFDLARCVLVTNETITAAINVLSDDPTRKLTITCGSTKIYEDSEFIENDTNKRLKLDLKTTDYSGFHKEFTLGNGIFDIDSDEDGDDYLYDDDDDDLYDDDVYFSDPDAFDIFDVLHDQYELNLGRRLYDFYGSDDDLHSDDDYYGDF